MPRQGWNIEGRWRTEHTEDLCQAQWTPQWIERSPLLPPASPHQPQDFLSCVSSSPPGPRSNEQMGRRGGSTDTILGLAQGCGTLRAAVTWRNTSWLWSAQPDRTICYFHTDLKWQRSMMEALWKMLTVFWQNLANDFSIMSGIFYRDSS